MTSPVLCALFFLTSLSSVLAADGKTHSLSVPAVTPAVIALILFGLSALVHWIQFFRFGRQPFMLALTLGMTAMAVGFVVRILVSHNPTSLGLNIVSTLLILLSPCLFLGLDYMILGRLAVMFGPDISNKAMFIAPTRVATIFVWSDVGTFLVQALGGSMTTSSNINSVHLGNKIALIGLALQLVSFALFMVLMLVFGSRVRTRFPHVWRGQQGKAFTVAGGEVGDWRILYFTLCVTCVAILVRSIYRLVQFIQGYGGYVSTHEVFFYCFDSLPLWMAMSLYCAVWPPRFLNSPPQGEALELRKQDGTPSYA
ncbi:RTA1 like protein-domain-containing protein [Mycena rosella]|uniref:RTA1 like protein-domain-containing protein n=1 Tax=Mycena rosella TaxID=1033263 RepID=A0AAD7GN60_MYCRO|nr:RTA1 like protein-domain-containing protein [Mycena rosella]